MGTAAYIDGFTRDWMQALIDLRCYGIEVPEYFLAPHYTVYTERFAQRDPKDLIDHWQACLDFDGREELWSCPVPIHAIAFSEDVQTPPQMVHVVADCALHGHYHEFPGLGHVSMTRHRADLVNARIVEIVDSTRLSVEPRK